MQSNQPISLISLSGKRMFEALGENTYIEIWLVNVFMSKISERVLKPRD